MGKFPKIYITFFVIVFVLSGLDSFSQRGKNGARTISAANTIINEYTTLTADAASGAISITVANSGLNANGRFTAALSAGDLIFIIQIQGVTIDDQYDYNISWGNILSYNNCGLNEFGEVLSVPNSTTINLVCPLKNNYAASGKVQVIRVPRLNSLTINTGASVTCDAWNGTIGGVAVAEVLGNTTVNGSINVTGQGFRGGQKHNSSSTTYGGQKYANTNNIEGGEKGEGVFGYQAEYDAAKGRYCRGAGGNAGGGGDCLNSGGGGGANAGDINLWTGNGVPNRGAGNIYDGAWNFEAAGFATSSSSGGGRGGYTVSNANRDAFVVTPGNTNWAGDNRRIFGGLGGRPLDYTTGRLFFGGGGGAGEMDNSRGGSGGNGGGIVYIMNYGSILGSGQILANGNAGENSTGGNNNSDGPGGAGAGGTIILNSAGSISGISAIANGGSGGNQIFTNPNGATEAQGPGGGGGGGYVAVSNGTAATQVNGGNNGTTNSFQLNEFPPNGATKGGNGVISTIPNFTLTANDDTICCGQTATLLVTINGTPPGGIIIDWYKDSVGGNIIYTGNPYVTIPLCVDTVYYASTCPGTYRIPVKVIIDSINVTAGTSTTICLGNSVQLNASGAVTYSWSPAAGLNQTNIRNPIASPTVTTTYIVTGTSLKGCTDTAKVVITVLPGTPINASPNQTICQGTSTVISATGGNSYTWNTGQTTSSITVNPTQTTTYTVTGINSCETITDNVIITVTPLPVANAGGDQNVCSGTSVNLTATGGTTYSWSTGQIINSITVSPTLTTTYVVTVSTACGSATDDVVVTISALPTANAGKDTTLCSGNNIVLTGNGGTNYSWSTGQTTQTISVSPTQTTTYTLTATSACGSASDAVVITVIPQPFVDAGINQTICFGSQVTITASGNGNFSWSSGETTNSITVSPTQTTTYIVSVSNSCNTVTDNVVVTVNPLPAAVTNNDTTICYGNNVIFTVTGGTNYIWSSGQNTSSVNVSPTQTITYTVTSTNSCGSATDAIIVTVIPQPSVDAGTDQTICLGLQVTIVASGNGSFSWSSGETTNSIMVSPVQTTTYTVSASNSCNTVTDDVVVIVNPLPAAVTNNDTIICFGNNIILTVTGGTNYTWNTGQNTSSINVSPTQITTYTVISSNSCGSATGDVVVDAAPLPSVNAGPDLSICSGTQSILVANGIGNFSWSTGETTTSITVAPINTTTYVVSAINNCGEATDYVIITTTTIPTANAGKDTSVCFGNNINLSANGGNSYIWSDGQTTQTILISPTQTITYTLTVTSNCGSATDEVVVSVLSPPTVVASQDATICSGTQTTVSATGSGVFVWSNGTSAQSMVVAPNQTTVYTVSAINSCGVATDNVLVNVNISPHNDFSFSAGCFGLPTIFSGTCDKPPSQISSWYWSFGDNASDITQNTQHTYLNTGNYFVKFRVTDLNGCKDSITKTVSINPGPTADFYYQQDPVNVDIAYFYDLSASNIVSWSWSFGDGGTSTDKNPTHTYDNTGTYTIILIVTNSDGCTDMIQKEIVLKPRPHIYIPNSFSPNRDGLNDNFNASIDQEMKEFKLLIFNRWGELIFQTTSQIQGWDGKYEGEIVQIGVYVYRLVVTFDSGEEYDSIGSVNVLR
ncbi:MAG: PKD domain-containing protein [Bacteroidales bacterium]|nr:PKD domain-containing protein [Bacteroidales bacterium]